MHFSASRSPTQPLLDCMRILYLTLTQHPYDPGTLPGSADQCILGNVYLRSSLPREQQYKCAKCLQPALSMQKAVCNLQTALADLTMLQSQPCAA